MKLIIGDRGKGKSFRMIRWFMENPAHRGIFVPNFQQRQRLIKEICTAFPEMGESTRAWVGNIWTPSSLSTRHGRTQPRDGVWIDNVDQLLRDMVGYNTPVTMTSSEDVEVERI